ncbi:MAG: hypothetical protein VKK62_08620 [Synechococcaceae cyanobacterium]|nr:hypothetical protein [Synechococcaceae cyanobacterium]
MSQSSSSRPQPSAGEPRDGDGAPVPAPGDNRPRPGGRYRFCGAQQLDPDAGVHPEMRSADLAAGSLEADAGAGVPASPAALLALQDPAPQPRPEKPEFQASAGVLQVMELIDRLDTRPADDLEIAFRLLLRLESFHDEVVQELREDSEASPSQLVAWAVDADRLMRARHLLGSVVLD